MKKYSNQQAAQFLLYSNQLNLKMPPKQAKPKKEQKTQQLQRIIPIFQILQDSKKEHTNQNIMNQVNDAIDHDHQNKTSGVKKSFLFAIMRICGLNEMVSKINWKNPQNSLRDMLEDIYETADKHQKFISDIPLADEKHPQHQNMNKALKGFLSICISSQCKLVEKTNILQDVHRWIQLLTMSKMRQVRASSTQFAFSFLQREAAYALELYEDGRQELAGKLSKGIEWFIDSIIPTKIKDIDQSIRKSSYKFLTSLLILVQGDIITKSRLSRIYYDAISQLSSLSLYDSLKSIRSLCQSFRGPSLSVLKGFIKNHISRIQDYCFYPNQIGIEAQKLLLQINAIDPEIKALKPKHISKIFEIYALQQFSEGLATSVDTFLHSLGVDIQSIPSRYVLMEAINLMNTIGTRRFVKVALKVFFDSCIRFFRVPEIINLLITEQYLADGQIIIIKNRQLEGLLITILELVAYAKKSKEAKKADWKKGVSQQYNDLILNNSKQILLDKISLHQNLCPLYLELLSSMFSPIESSTNLDFIINRMRGIFDGEQRRQVIVKVVEVYKAVNTHPIDQLVKKIDVEGIKRGKITSFEIVRVQALLSTYAIQEFLDNKFLFQIMKFFEQIDINASKMQMQIIAILFVAHHWKFKQLLQNPDQLLLQEYQQYRNSVMNLFFHVLTDRRITQIVHLEVFKFICIMVSICSNNQFVDCPSLYYSLHSRQCQSLIQFASNYIGEPQDNSNVLVNLMATLSFQDKQIRKGVIKNMMDMLKNCNKISTNSHFAKFIFERLKDQSLRPYIMNLFDSFIHEQVKRPSESAFVFWGLVDQLIQLNVDKQVEQKEAFVSKVVEIYFKKKQTASIHKKMLQKMILFVADKIDSYTRDPNTHSRLKFLEMIIKKVNRRYNKATLNRLFAFLTGKVQNLQGCQQAKSFLKLMNSICQTKGKKKAAGPASENQQSENDTIKEQNEGQQNEDEQNDDANDNQQREYHRRVQNNVRVTRSVRKSEGKSTVKKSQ